MFLLIFIFNILSAQEVTLEFNDWNYDTKIEIDSLNIRNIGLGIDTTLINPKSIDIHNLLIINDVEEERLNKYSLNYSSNILKINSKEIINNLKVIDLLGKTIFEDSPNNTSFEKSINLQENLTFVILTINNKTYSQKLYNINEEFYKSPSLIMNDESTWYFTPYKEKYRDTTYTFQNYQLKDTLNLNLKRERYLVEILFNLKNVYYSYKEHSFNPGTHESKDSTYINNIDIKDKLLFKLFDEKTNKNNGYYDVCNDIEIEYIKSGFKIFNSNEEQEPTIYSINIIFENDKIIEVIYNKFYRYRSGTYSSSCISKEIDLILNENIKLEDINIELNYKKLYSFSYKIKDDENWSNYFKDEFTSKFNGNVEDDDEIILNISIKKLD